MMTSTEHIEWRTIPNHNGYEVSSCGKVRSVDRWNNYEWKGLPYQRFSKGRMLSQTQNPQNGYMYVHLGRRRIMTVHRLVALAFIGESKEMVLHLDGDKTNNTVDNLRYGGGDENYADGVRHGTMHVGEKHYNSILTEELVREIRGRALTEPASEIARSLGFKYPTVLAVVNRKTWKWV